MNVETATTVLTTEAPAEPEAPEAGASTEEAPGEGAATTSEAEGEGGEGKGSSEPEGAPETYADFTFAEGLQMDPELMGKFAPLAKELNLPQAAAQKLVDIAGELVLKQAAAHQEVFKSTVDGWVNAAKADKEFGGDKFKGSIEVAQRALNTFATPELKEALNTTGLGNHPEMIRLMVKVGNAMKEDGIVTGGSPSQSAPKSAAEILYGKP